MTSNLIRGLLPLAAACCLAGLPLRAEPVTRTADGFDLPQKGRVFQFPRDFGSHDTFKLEWWYVTGHLFDARGGRFGFQATFFRSALAPPRPADPPDPPSDFGGNTLYLAHMALLDARQGVFVHQQRLNRQGWDAAAAADHLDVRNGNWWLRMTDTNHLTMELQGTVGGQAAFQLELKPVKPLVVFGRDSVSQKAADPAAASYYLTFPRLEAAGQVVTGGETNQVRGEAWMDHEISSSQLGAGQAGWDWCCLQLTNNREIMAYRMRRRDGSQDSYSTLAWVDAVGRVRQLPSAAFQLETLRRWRSPVTGAEYPVEQRLVTMDPATGATVVFHLQPLALNQELAGAGGLAYWEGACRVLDSNGREIGSAYLELTGYAGDLAPSLR